MHPKEYSQELCFYPFAVHLDSYAGSCNSLDGLSTRECVPNETKDLNLHVFSMITKISKSKTLTKHVLCKCKWKSDSKKYNSNQTWNDNKCWCESKNPKKTVHAKKIIFEISNI